MRTILDYILLLVFSLPILFLIGLPIFLWAWVIAAMCGLVAL